MYGSINNDDGYDFHSNFDFRDAESIFEVRNKSQCRNSLEDLGGLDQEVRTILEVTFLECSIPILTKDFRNQALTIRFFHHFRQIRSVVVKDLL